MMRETVLYGLLAALANILGGLWITSPGNKVSRTPLTYLLALGAGFLLAAVFLKVIPASLRLPRWHEQMEIPLLLVLGGYLLIQFFEHTVAPHFHFGEETHGEAVLATPAMVAAVGGLAMHTFFDGVAIASSTTVDPRLGLIVFIAIVLHKIPEGFTVASIVLASGRSPQVARSATTVVALATLAGVAAVAAARESVVYALPLSAGVTLYVATSDLIPEINKAERGFISLVVFGGVALYYATEKVLERVGL